MVWLVLQQKHLVWNVSCNIGMACVITQTVGPKCFLQQLYDFCVTTQTFGLKCFLQHWYDLCYNTNSWFELFLSNIGITCVTTQTVGLKCFLQHWYDLCYNTNSCFVMFLATMVWLVLQQKHLVWNVSCKHWYDLCYNTNSCFVMFLATMVWLVLQQKHLVWNVSCNIGMACVTTQTVGPKCFLQHWYDLCYNTNSCFELFLATLVWLALQHNQLLWTVFLQHWYDLCYNTNSCFELFLATLVWLVLQHKQLLWIVSCNIGMTCVTTQTVALNCFLQHWYDLCYNTNSCFELFLATLVWLVLQHKQLLCNVSCNIGMTCVTTQTVALNCFLQHWYDLCYNTNSCFELFLATLEWLVLQHKQLLWIVSYHIGMTCVTTQTVALKYFLQHWYGLVLQHK